MGTQFIKGGRRLIATITRTTTWSDGQTLTASALNGEFNNSLNALAIVNADISASAAIAISKINTGVSGSIVGTTDTQTLTSKRITKRTLSLSANSATPAINTDSYDIVHITSQTAAITSFTSGLTGTPVDGDTLRISITGTGAVGLTWGTSFESSSVTLPTTTVSTSRLDIGFFWNSETSKWRCVATS